MHTYYIYYYNNMQQFINMNNQQTHVNVNNCLVNNLCNCLSFPYFPNFPYT